MKFALVETHRAAPTNAAVEVMLTTGERVRIVPGIDAATLCWARKARPAMPPLVGIHHMNTSGGQVGRNGEVAGLDTGGGPAVRQ